MIIMGVWDGRLAFSRRLLSLGSSAARIAHQKDKRDSEQHNIRPTTTIQSPETRHRSPLSSRRLTPGGFLSGQVLDEEGQPPERCWFTLLGSGARGGKSGYRDDPGDHRASEDGTQCA
jgi:hypothetical protein